MTLDNFKIGKYVKLNDDLIYKISYSNGSYYLSCNMLSDKHYSNKHWDSIEDMKNDIKMDIIEISDTIKHASFRVFVDAYFDTTILIPKDMDKESVRKYIIDNLDKIPITNELEYIPETDTLDEEEEITIY